MAEIAGAVLYGIKEVAESAALLAKGIYDPTLPLKARLQSINSVDLPLAQLTVSIIKGRAYLFGGKTTSNNGNESTSNDMHIIILPTSGMESVDYKKVGATNQTPPGRYGHSAAVIDERIYIFGGNGDDGSPLEENGRVWIFDTVNDQWSYLDPPDGGERPSARSSHASVASEHPRPLVRTPHIELPQQPPDPETTMPDIPDPDTYGTLIIQGGRAKSENNLVDIWSFDISTKTWAALPDPPGPSSPSPSIALAGRTIYAFSAGETSFLDLDPGAFDDDHGKGELGITPLRPWQTLRPTSSSPEKNHPGGRTNASLIPITTGQGRNYLLLVGGKSRSGEVLEDIWSLQLKPEGMTAASFKDAARTVIKKDTMEAEWEEVKYYNAEGVMIQEGQEGRGIGIREGFAATADTEKDGSSLLLWGGIDADGSLRGDGLAVTVDV